MMRTIPKTELTPEAVEGRARRLAAQHGMTLSRLSAKMGGGYALFDRETRERESDLTLHDLVERFGLLRPSETIKGDVA